MSIFGNNLSKARAAAHANADHFGVPFYVVSCSDGLRVEREKPGDARLIAFIAEPEIDDDGPYDPERAGGLYEPLSDNLD